MTEIEKEVGRTVLWLPCRHFTHELILKTVFDECYHVPSSGPDITIFRKFQRHWESLDKNSYTTMLEEEPMEGFLEDQRVKMVEYLQKILVDANHP